MTESLEKLLREAKLHAWKETHKDPREKLARERQSVQAQRWTNGALVQLWHESEGSLGVFREQLFNTGGRRLVPEEGTPERVEKVTGQHWLETKTYSAIEDDSPYEIEAIGKRFRELLADWPEDDDEV